MAQRSIDRIDTVQSAKQSLDKNLRSAELIEERFKIWARVKKFYDLYAVRHKGKIGVLLFGAILAGVLEVTGILLLYLLLRVMLAGGAHSEIEHIFKDIFVSLGLTTKLSFVIGMGSLITFIFVLKNIYIIFYYHYQHLTLKEWKLGLSSMLMQKYLHAPYSFLLGYNSATLIRNINSVVNSSLSGFVLSVFNFAANTIVCAIIVSFLFVKFFGVTLLVVGVLISCTIVQNSFLKKKSLAIGREREALGSLRSKHVYQGIHALKETKVIGRENHFLEIFRTLNSRSVDIELRSSFLSRIPAHITEIIVIIAIVMFSSAVFVDYEYDAATSVSLLGVLAAVAFRLAPLMNRTLTAMQGMQKNMSAIDTMFGEMFKLEEFNVWTKDHEEIEPLHLKKSFVFDQVSFRYPNANTEAVKNVSFAIKSGQIVGIVGESGAGKTTIADLILGLIHPSHGVISIGGVSLLSSNAKNWQRNLAYVPQFIYLHDDSIANNVAFGIPADKIDRKKVYSVLKEVQLDYFVAKLDEGIDFVIGENGKNLSGGQRQRLGIARALYLDASVFVFDEATAALDVPTEHKITDTIKLLSGQKTVFIIAHRLSTILDADIIIFVKEGSIDGIGTYSELFASNEGFERMARMAKILPAS